ncbi:MAG: hypothetical protein CM15mP32_0860 [Flavobacteriaceae bacterium]|nr:MAG: hypothetical protein CM15mP32_0860 [Flavobacteriaceae bacterium]
MQAVKDYINDDKSCKQTLILDYFGETNKTRVVNAVVVLLHQACATSKFYLDVLKQQPATVKSFQNCLK